MCVATHYSYDPIFNNETVAEVRHHWKGAFAFGAPDLVTFNIHGDGKVWWREGVAAQSSQTPRPVFASMITYPAPRHQVYDVINATIKQGERNRPKAVVSEGPHAGVGQGVAVYERHHNPEPVRKAKGAGQEVARRGSGHFKRYVTTCS